MSVATLGATVQQFSPLLVERSAPVVVAPLVTFPQGCRSPSYGSCLADDHDAVLGVGPVVGGLVVVPAWAGWTARSGRSHAGPFADHGTCSENGLLFFSSDFCHLSIFCLSAGSRLMTFLGLGDVKAATPHELGSRGRRGSHDVPADCAGKGTVVCRLKGAGVCLQPAVCHS